MNLTWASRTDTGALRDHNEDSLFPIGGGTTDGSLVAAVADGMGGHVGGEIASSVAISAAMDLDGSPEERVKAANDAVLARVDTEPDLRGMGTTLTLAMVDDEGHVVIGHVGDSRGYLLRGDALSQLTRDHSVVGELIEAGQLRPEDAAFHPYRNVITRALGLQGVVAVDLIEHDFEPGDVLILCSDGLNSMIDDAAITRLLIEAADPNEAVDALVDAANAAGGHDNISVVLIAAE